ncbi:MAG: hypothetical protein HYX25_09630 [Candidatus Solibacter usitatus]|nr:hypothetical protein [Candidatus Solibacter usitatus]
MMNLHYYWSAGPAKALQGNLLFFSTFYRPMGAAFYLPIYHFAGLNPFPYRAVIFLLLGVNVVLMWRFAALLTGDYLVAFIAAFAVSNHGYLADLHIVTAVVYDILCFFFYFSAFVVYLGIRSRGRLLTWKQSAGVLLLYIGALNSKEMAVTFPVFVLAYELLYHAPEDWSRLSRWLLSEGRLAILSGLLTLAYVIGKLTGTDSLNQMELYRSIYTVQRFMEQQTLYLNALFYAGAFFTPAKTIALWLALVYLAWRRPSPQLRFCQIFVVLSPLPIVFLTGRIWSCLYIPLAGWAILLGSLTVSAARWIAILPGLRRWHQPVVTGLLVATAIGVVGREAVIWTKYFRPILLDAERPVLTAIRSFQTLGLKVPANSTMMILDDPMPRYDLVLIARLVTGEPTLRVWTKKTEGRPSPHSTGLDHYDYVLRMELNGVAVVQDRSDAAPAANQK